MAFYKSPNLTECSNNLDNYMACLNTTNIELLTKSSML